MSGTGIAIEFHQGKVLMRLAKHYADLLAVTLEVVQNAVDALATRIEIQLNLAKHTLTVCDNGTGASREKVALALKSVGDTMKKSKGMYGQFGLGLIAPLSVADEFTLTSCPEARVGSYTDYFFVTEKIQKQREVFIPDEPAPRLSFEPDGAIWWRTRMHLRGITKDKRRSEVSLDGLANAIVLKYGEKIRQNKIQVDLTVTDTAGDSATLAVKAQEFSGAPLEPYAAKNPESGAIKIELFVARLGRGGRKGQIAFGSFENPSRISAEQFVACARVLIEPEVAKTLTSGVLEGTIRCEKVALHADRTRFEDSDALLGLCQALDEWHDEVGKKVLEDTASVDSDNRFQRIGTSVMPYAELLLKQEQFQSVVGRITIGTIGTGHAKVPKKLVVGKDSGVAISVDGSPFEGRGRGEEGGGNGRTTPKKENPEHTPGIVYGARGKRRTEVKGSSTGLRLEYVELEEFRTPFVFTPETGVLSFNTNHPSWGQCQQNDAYLQKYNIAVVTTALTLETFRDAEGNLSSELEHFARESINHQTFAILNGEAMLAKTGK